MARLPVPLFVYILCSIYLVEGGAPNVGALFQDLYTLTSDKLENGGGCKQVLHVSGKGISDSFQVSCDNTQGVEGRTFDSFMFYDNPGDSLSLLSETPSHLVVIKGGECRLRTYTTTNGQTRSSSSAISTSACDRAKKRVRTEKMRLRLNTTPQSRGIIGDIIRRFPMCIPFCITSVLYDRLKPFYYGTPTTAQESKGTHQDLPPKDVYLDNTPSNPTKNDDKKSKPAVKYPSDDAPSDWNF